MLLSFPKVLKKQLERTFFSDVKQNKSSGTQQAAQIFINKYLDASGVVGESKREKGIAEKKQISNI
jgi:hypothetical protein